MTTRREKIIEKAIELLKANPDGLRYSELVKAIYEHFENIPINTIYGAVWDIHSQLPKKVYKPSRGLFRLIEYRSKESLRSDMIEAPIEIVSAEIKTEVNQLVTAFGQACSYRLFSHKSYLVIPNRSPRDEIARLDSLCIVFGIGLILFDSFSPTNPQFDIMVRPIKQEPDMFYVNKYMKHVERELFT